MLLYVRKNVTSFVRKHVTRYVRKNVRRYVRKHVTRYVRKNVRRNVRKHIKRYVRKNDRGDIPDEPSFTHSLRIVQHLHDRISPWSLNEILLNYLYNRGVAVLALHDGLDAQRAYAELHNKLPFKPWSHFGDYRHDYEKVVPTLKYFSAATFFASFLLPMTYEQLEAREGALGATYCPDLLDLLLGLFSYMGIAPPLHFGATCDAVLLRGCHRAPNGDILPMLHTSMDVHESPEAFYSRTFLQLLRIPALKKMGFSQEDVYALEDCLRQALMNLPLIEALDFLHSQLLSSMCISPPARKDNNPAPFASPPLKRHFQWPAGTADPPPSPPSFHVWITRKVAPHMAVVDLRCDAVPWACFRRGPTGQHQFGIHSSNFIQFVFPATDAFPAQSGLFSFALYISKVALKGRVVLENPDQVGDPSAVNSWASFCLSSCTTLSRSPAVRALRPSPRHSTSSVYPYWTASTPPLKPASFFFCPGLRLSRPFQTPRQRPVLSPP